MPTSFTATSSAAGFRSLGRSARAQLEIARSIAEQAKVLKTLLEANPDIEPAIRESIEGVIKSLVESGEKLSRNAVETSNTVIGIVSDVSSGS